jgi:hypothetical protein
MSTPQRPDTTVAAYAERWLQAQPLRLSSRRTYERYLREAIAALLDLVVTSPRCCGGP